MRPWESARAEGGEHAIVEGRQAEGAELRKVKQTGTRRQAVITRRGDQGVRVATDSVFSPRKHWKSTTQ